LTIEINTIGCPECRSDYRRKLIRYLKSNQSSLCPDCRRRLKENPLRVLDCKNEKCQEVIKSAPQMIEHLCKDCHSHFKNVLEFLEELELPYSLNPYLVRGLDYYTRTVFEIFPNLSEKGKESLGLEGKRIALAGGGRYDGLVKLLGGKETPACGGAAGVERIVSLMKIMGKKIPARKQPQIFLAQVGELSKRKALRIFEDLRKNNIKVAEAFYKDSLVEQLEIADKLGMKFVLILGQKEAIDNEIIIRDMDTGKQKIIPFKKIIKHVKKIIK